MKEGAAHLMECDTTPPLGAVVFTQRVHTRLVLQLQRLMRALGQLVPEARARGCAGTNYPFLTQYERDNETGLDYAQARYYSSIEGRFTSADPLMASARSSAPETWNRYSYGLNNPMKYIDPSGLNADDIGTAEDQRREEQQPKPTQQQAVSTNQVKVGNVTVKVEQIDEPAAFDSKNINGVLRTGVGVQLVFSFTENGKPVTGATVTESVEALKGEPITQNQQPVPLDKNGKGSDFVTNSAPTHTNREQAQKLYQRVTGPFVTEQKATFILTLARGTKIEITQVRSLTNLTPQGTLQPVDRALGTPGYTFKMQPLKARVIKR